jgi:hypothetical protein
MERKAYARVCPNFEYTTPNQPTCDSLQFSQHQPYIISIPLLIFFCTVYWICLALSYKYKPLLPMKWLICQISKPRCAITEFIMSVGAHCLRKGGSRQKYLDLEIAQILELDEIILFFVFSLS